VDGFEIRTGGDFIRLCLEEVFEFPNRTSFFGGYDARGRVDIQRGPYHAYGSLWFSTGEIWQFYTELLKVYDDLTGEARFRSSEGQLEFTITFRFGGHLTIEGVYQEVSVDSTRLLFKTGSDQSYLIEPLAQLAEFVAKYGDNRGLAGLHDKR
jgi:hypothetical protein